jgi:hypothetical protein
MNNFERFGLILVLSGTIAVLSFAIAQPPDGKIAKGPAKGTDRDWSTHPIVTRMMAFDKNKDGKLTKDEVTDTRLHRLFDRADKNKDGVVSREELIALAKEMDAESGGEGGGGGPDGFGKGKRGKGGPPVDDDGPLPGGPGGRGPGGFGGHAPGGLPRPGQVLPPFLQDRLELSAEQKKQLESLQKEVYARLDKILTAAQKKQLKEIREGFGPGGRGPGGRGSGGSGGRGPGGPPPE